MEELKNLLTVIIPTLNEVEGIGLVIDELLSVGIPKDSILVVDGGSTDGTVDIVKSKDVKLVIQEGRGKALAIATALKYVKTPYIAILDGDYTYPAKYIPELLKKALEGYDVVLGFRKYVEGTQLLIYRLGNYILTKLFNILFNTRLSDVLTGMYVVKTSKLNELNFEFSGFSVEAEIITHIASTSGRVTEVPIEYRRRLGKKKLGVLDGFKIARDMLRLTWRYNPTFLIFLLGSLLLIPGLVLGGYVAYHYFFTGIKYYVRGLIAIMLTLAGFQSLIAAIITLYVKRVELRILRSIEDLRSSRE